MPFWGQKLATPAFYKPEKYQRFLKQWDLRIGLELIKMNHAIFAAAGNVDKQSKMQMKEEIDNYL